MHALEIIIARNAEAAGISVEQNLRDARAGQSISQADERAPAADDTANPPHGVPDSPDEP